MLDAHGEEALVRWHEPVVEVADTQIALTA